jgi:histone H3/H4
MPLEDMYDDDSFHERPPRQSLLPELPEDVDGETIQSLEFGRRALSEDPRRAGRVSERFADFSELGAVEEEEYEVDGTFINQRRTPGFETLLDRTVDNVLDEDDTTHRVLNGREDGPSSDMDLGVFGEADDDTLEATFRFHIPDRIPAPLRENNEDNAPEALDDAGDLTDVLEDDDATQPESQGEEDITQPDLQAEEEEEPMADQDEGDLTRLVEDDPTDAFGMTGWESDPGLEEDPQLTAYREEESALDRSLQSPEHAAAVKKRLGNRRKELRVSRYGLDYPSFPAASVKKLATGLMQSRGSKGKISKDTLDVLVQTTDDFFEQIGGDLAAYAQHGGRKVIEESDVIALMKRYVTFRLVYSCVHAIRRAWLTPAEPARLQTTTRHFRWHRSCFPESCYSN